MNEYEWERPKATSPIVWPNPIAVRRTSTEIDAYLRLEYPAESRTWGLNSLFEVEPAEVLRDSPSRRPRVGARGTGWFGRLFRRPTAETTLDSTGDVASPSAEA